MAKRYPAIELVAKWGRLGALIIAVLAGLINVACYLTTGNIIGAIISVAGAVILWGALRVAAEMIEVISETLLPQ